MPSEAAAGPGGYTTAMLRWIILLAIGIRLAVWAVVPGSRFASDEESYYRAGVALATTGTADLFWPPLTPWIVALAHAIVPEASIKALRLLWVAMDLGCLLLVRVLAVRVAGAAPGAFTASMPTVATAAYAVYLPAISHAQFVTSETPALLQVLLILVLLTAPRAGLLRSAATGVVAGMMVLTRPSLAPPLVLLPLAAAWRRGPGEFGWGHAAAVIGAGSAIVGALVIHNGVRYGEFTIASNSAYNLYIGNREMYAEDLNLFAPRATPEQIAFRQAFFRGEATYPAQPPAELQREALRWIADHPGTFLQRALGRLARVFAPKTDVLELAGGEAAVGVWSPPALALLAAANLQWAVILALGIAGALRLWSASPYHGGLFMATIAGAVALCLVAIAKPRYAFVFEPILMLCAAWHVLAPGRLAPGTRRVALAAYGFLVWAWIAWAIFAVTSRPPS